MMASKLFSYLEDHALSWYFDTIQDRVKSVREIEELFIQRFGAVDIVSYEEIHSLRWDSRNETLPQYFQRGLNLLNNADLKSKLQIEILTRGLPFKMREKLVVQDIVSPSHWYELVKRINSFRESNYESKKFDRPMRGESSKQDIRQGDKMRKTELKCDYCEYTNHTTKACFFNPSNRRGKKEHSSEGVNAVKEDDSVSQISVDDQSVVSKVLEINSEDANYQEEKKYAIMNIDNKIKVEGLVDSGATRCAIDIKICQEHQLPIIKKQRTLSHVLAHFKTAGVVYIMLEINGTSRRVEADVMPLHTETFILGTKAFRHFGFSLQGQGLIARSKRADIASILSIEEDKEIVNITNKYETLFSEHDFDVGGHDIIECKIALKADAKPHSVPPRRLSIKNQEEEKKQIQQLHKFKIIQRSYSPWAAGITFVDRQGKSPRLCGDYRILNSMTIADKYPIPRIDYILMNLKGAKVYSKLDLTRGYNNVKIAQQDRFKTAFITNVGLWECVRMPFGLKNAPAVFQRYMEIIISDCSDFTKVYFDDILLYSDSKRQHISHLEKFFKTAKVQR